MVALFCSSCDFKIAGTKFCTKTGLSHISVGKVTGTHSSSGSGSSSDSSAGSGFGRLAPSAVREYIDMDAAPEPSSGSNLSAKILQEKKQIGKKDAQKANKPF